jgi:hypothetical protein
LGPEVGVFNVCSGEGKKIEDLVSVLAQKYGGKSLIKTKKNITTSSVKSRVVGVPGNKN